MRIPLRLTCSLAACLASALPLAAQATTVVIPGTAPPAGRGPQLEVAPAAVLTNGIVERDGDLALFVSEASSGPGGSDLNGDGDVNDRVLALLDGASGQLEVTDLDGRFLAVGDGFVAVHRYESDSETDFDGDGNLDDQAIFVRDLATGTTTNLGIDTVSLYVAEGDLLAFRGRTPFLRLFFYTHSTGVVTQIGEDTIDVVVSPQGVAFTQWEAGGPDLNGDGDTQDFVPQVLLPDLTTQFNTGVVSSRLLGFVGSKLVFRAREVALERDVDGDGALDDDVLFVYDSASASRRTAGVIADEFSAEVQLRDGRLFFRQSEAFAGDLNGDGDVLDRILVAYDVASETTSVSGLAARFVDFEAPHALAFLVEEDAAQDANGDGDQLDHVALIWDVGAGSHVNLGRATLPSLPGGIGPRRAVYLTSEFAEGVDRNGDGDIFDQYVEVYDRLSGFSRGFDKPAGSDALRSGDQRRGFLFRVIESATTGDLNGDGDLHDGVVHVMDFASGAVTNSGLAGTFSAHVRGRRFAFVGIESGTDLNGDGDGDDQVLVVGRLP